MNRKIDMTGSVRPPADMIGAARASLSPHAFADLMNQTGGQAPTPAQLCAAAELERSQPRSGDLAARVDDLAMTAQGSHAAA